MAVIPLVPETKMADVGKLISLGNLLDRKTTWFVLTTTSATLILSRDFGADCMTSIAYIYSRLSRTHSFHFNSQRKHALLHCDLQRQLILSILTHRDNTHTHTHTHTLSITFDFQQSTPRKCILSATIFFLVLHLLLELLQPRKQPQKFRQTTERNKQPAWEKTRSS